MTQRRPIDDLLASSEPLGRSLSIPLSSIAEAPAVSGIEAVLWALENADAMLGPYARKHSVRSIGVGADLHSGVDFETGVFSIDASELVDSVVYFVASRDIGAFSPLEEQHVSRVRVADAAAMFYVQKRFTGGEVDPEVERWLIHEWPLDADYGMRGGDQIQKRGMRWGR